LDGAVLGLYSEIRVWLPESEKDKGKTEDLPAIVERPKTDEQRKSEKQSS